MRFYNCELNIDFFQDTGNEAGVKTIGVSGRIGAENCHGESFSQQSHRERVLGCTRYSLQRILSKGMKNNWRILFQIIAQAQR